LSIFHTIMITTVDIIQFSYFVPSIILLIIFMLIKRNPVYDNNFFPLILFKSYTIYYNIILGICNIIIYGVSLLSSLNTFIALTYPLRYNIWFSKKRIVICLTIIILVGLIYGIGMICFHPYYKYSKSIKGYIVSFKSLDVTYCALVYAIIVIFPIAILSTIMNIF
uniref:G_PROTEIN_RECEP_F1_2 domain-containing protein n=1 Tax=Strongyloides papillosus TaxID=174720 RepID=A0A0N5CIS5_STREA